MVPAVIFAIDMLPRLASSGKIDRNALAARSLPEADASIQLEEAETPTEAQLLGVIAPLFPGQAVVPSADFFLDMGGHSLLAAQFVSAARLEESLRHMTLGQIYQGRTIRGIGALLDAARRADHQVPLEPFHRPPALRRFWCGLAQLAVMPMILTLMSAPWLSIFITYDLVTGDNSSLFHDISLVFFAYAIVNFLTAALVVAAKWSILGRTKPGVYPLWGSYYFRVWLVQRLLSLVHLKWMQNTPVLRGYLRLLGAKVGPGALISDFDAGALDLVEFGANASIGSKVVFANARIDGAHMIVGRIRIGDDAVIGSSCAIEGDAEIGDGAEIGDLTSLVGGSRIPAWQRWSGAPARYEGDNDPADLSASPIQGSASRAFHYIIYTTMLLLLPAVSIVTIVPAFRLMEWLDSFINPIIGINYLWYMPVLALSAAAAMIAATLALIVACRWLLLPSVRPGRYAVTSGFYLRRWAMGLLIEAALDTLSTLFATLYMRVWYRAMGSKIGKGSEISTSFAGRYELIELGADNFIADDVVLGDDSLRRGWLTLERTRTGNRVFIGNEAVVPQGSIIGDGALIGVRSRTPDGGAVGPGETWFGSPAIRLPARQRFDHDARQTFAPSRRMKVARAAFEAFNISLPTALFITLVTIVMEILAPVFDRQNWGKAIWICILASTLIAVIQLFVSVVYKWLLMGRYRPTMKPMWSWWALRTEAVAVMYWGMAGKALLDVMRGTPFLPIALRLFGVKSGKGIYLDSADITEFDCVTIGDYAVLNNHAVLQTHLYEDRLMKVGRIAVGRGAVIGAGSTVLYDTNIGDDARLGPLTLVMKGEHIPSNSHFSGSPAQSVG
jgi:non-ribosomal peptide synthetase-like protein